MVVSADVGVAENVHPPDKQTIGARLVLAARALAYQEPIEYSGPAYRQTGLEPGKIRVWLDHANGFNASEGKLLGFEVAGADHRFFAASALVEGSTVVASSSSVANPIYVRYAWSASSPMTLFNREGLPASPFNSDDTYANQDQPSK
jgi:sialate O-acetylesterase